MSENSRKEKKGLRGIFGLLKRLFRKNESEDSLSESPPAEVSAETISSVVQAVDEVEAPEVFQAVPSIPEEEVMVDPSPVAVVTAASPEPEKPVARVEEELSVFRPKAFPPMDPSARRFWVYINNEVHGPYTSDQVTAMKDHTIVSGDQPCCEEGEKNWKTVAELLKG